MPKRVHTLRSFACYGWREKSTVIGFVLVVIGLAMFLTLSKAEIEEYTGRLLALAGMIAAGVAVARGILGVVHDTTKPKDDGA